MADGTAAVGFTRRALIAAGAVGAVEVALSACGSHPAAHRSALEGFLELSRVVAGERSLPTHLAPAYLDALGEARLSMSPNELATRAGYTHGRGPGDFVALARSPAYRARGAAECARAIAAAWWSGAVALGENRTRVVTYTEAVVYQAIPFARPQTVCLGATGAWASA